MGLPLCILDKGKPVVRPGRKAKDQPRLFVRRNSFRSCEGASGGLVTERVLVERPRKRPLWDKHFQFVGEGMVRVRKTWVWPRCVAGQAGPQGPTKHRGHPLFT